MATPSQVRRALGLVAGAAAADLQAVGVAAAQSGSPSEIRAALFAATPLIVGEYTAGSSALALEWYDDLRDAAQVLQRFSPRPLVLVTDDELAAIVAETTGALYDIQRGIEEGLQAALTESLELLEAEIVEEVAQAFRDTVTGNVANDPAAVGWRRFARPEACKFCLMLAARGAVYTESTARFAAHGAVMNGNRKGGNCMCIAGPAFGGTDAWTEATPMQYVASSTSRTPAQQAALREYLNANYPDAPG